MTICLFWKEEAEGLKADGRIPSSQERSLEPEPLEWRKRVGGLANSQDLSAPERIWAPRPSQLHQPPGSNDLGQDAKRTQGNLRAATLWALQQEPGRRTEARKEEQ